MSLTDDVDGWISQLMQCKPLSENEVKKLCEKVSLPGFLTSTVSRMGEGREMSIGGVGTWIPGYNREGDRDRARLCDE